MSCPVADSGLAYNVQGAEGIVLLRDGVAIRVFAFMIDAVVPLLQMPLITPFRRTAMVQTEREKRSIRAVLIPPVLTLQHGALMISAERMPAISDSRRITILRIDKLALAFKASRDRTSGICLTSLIVPHSSHPDSRNTYGPHTPHHAAAS